jgi:hypothetical protein
MISLKVGFGSFFNGVIGWFSESFKKIYVFSSVGFDVSGNVVSSLCNSSLTL